MSSVYFDYRAIEALNAVIEMQGFDLAAKCLHITQSAVSQRIKSLQTNYSDPIIIREQPYRPTALGEMLIAHFKRIEALEKYTRNEITEPNARQTIEIAINYDGLQSWMTNMVRDSTKLTNCILRIISDDDDRVLSHLRSGHSSIAFCSDKQKQSNCHVSHVGDIKYSLVASPSFYDQYFKGNDLKKSLSSAPGILFDNHDQLHQYYLKKHFNITKKQPPYHYIPSIHSMSELISAGIGYTLIPEMTIKSKLAKKELVNIAPSHPWYMPVYMHSWSLQHERHSSLVDYLYNQAKNIISEWHS